MLEFLTSIKPYLESLYFLSGIFLIIGVVLTYRQLTLIKNDSRVKNQRAAAEKALEISELYLDEYIKLDSVYFHALENNNLSVYSGPIGDFSQKSICDLLTKTIRDRFQLHGWAPALNRLESIAAHFTSGVADERVGFRIIGRSYCGTVENYYDIISFCRDKDIHDYWSNIVELYQLWAPRLKKAEKGLLLDKLKIEISHIPNIDIPPIGINKSPDK